MVLLHELAHIRRGDLATQLLVRTAVALFWWNPLAWFAWREFVKERERAADDLVLTAGEPAAAYAGHLLDIARSIGHVPTLVSAAAAMARRSQLEGRLISILDARANRQSPSPRAALAAALLAAALVAPFAALQAQDKPDPAIQPNIDAAIKAATAQQNHEITDAAAAQYIDARKYDAAQQLLENSLAIREQTSGQHSSAYAIGLMKLGDLAARRGKAGDATDFYGKAVALGDTPETAPALVYLSARALGAKDTVTAENYIDRALAVAPSGTVAGRALTVKGNIALSNGLPGVAELQYLQALAQDEPDSADAAFTMESYAQFLTGQGRTAEAETMQQQAFPIRQARVAAISARSARAGGLFSFQSSSQSSNVMFAARSTVPRDESTGGASQVTVGVRAPDPAPAAAAGVLRVGNGVSAPVLLRKTEPEYSEEARAAKYQGTVLLRVVISPEGQATQLTLIKGLGFGLDEKAAEAVSAWQFKPGQRDGSPVSVEASIEVNFRLL